MLLGGKLALRYGVRGVPTLVLLNGAGEVVLKQVGMPERVEIIDTVRGLSEP